MDKVQHFELPVDNLERAKKFYKSIFGWELKDAPEMSYTMITTVPTNKEGVPKEAGAINGGMFKRSDFEFDFQAPWSSTSRFPSHLVPTHLQ